MSGAQIFLRRSQSEFSKWLWKQNQALSASLKLIVECTCFIYQQSSLVSSYFNPAYLSDYKVELEKRMKIIF